jgi:redox-sensitive bicupin YhaK (pirin superfamily)
MEISMTKTIHRANTRGFANHGWLRTSHTFSFANYHNAERMNFGALRVLNDDWIAPGMGFGTHPHRNMEIVTIPLSGMLAHKDSMGHQQTLQKNEIQVMSAGQGLTHSEFNALSDAPTALLQIWVLPKVIDIPPRYEQKIFSAADRLNQFHTVVSPVRSDNTLWINQDAYFSLADIEAGNTIAYTAHNPDRGLYLFVISGSVKVTDETISERDAIGVTGESSISLEAEVASEIVMIEVPLV